MGVDSVGVEFCHIPIDKPVAVNTGLALPHRPWFSRVKQRAVFTSAIFWRGIPPPQKKNLQPRQTAAKMVCSKSFFLRDSQLQIFHGNFLLMDN